MCENRRFCSANQIGLVVDVRRIIYRTPYSPLLAPRTDWQSTQTFPLRDLLTERVGRHLKHAYVQSAANIDWRGVRVILLRSIFHCSRWRLTVHAGCCYASTVKFSGWTPSRSWRSRRAMIWADCSGG